MSNPITYINAEAKFLPVPGETFPRTSAQRVPLYARSDGYLTRSADAGQLIGHGYLGPDDLLVVAV